MNLKVAEEFSFTPGPRYILEGDFSGEDFRQRILAPAIKEAIELGYTLVVDLDGTAGYGRSFLEEAFGGLIRRDELLYENIETHLKIISDEEVYLKDKILRYLRNAQHAERKEMATAK